MAIGVVNALEYQRKRLGDLAPGYNHLHDVLAVCLRRISSIQDITGKSHISQTQGNLSLKSWARLRLSLKGDEILELERQLGLSLQVLNVSLTTSLFYNDLPLAHGKEMTDVSYLDGDTAAESIVSMADILGNTEIGRFLHSQGCNFELFAIQSTYGQPFPDDAHMFSSRVVAELLSLG
ncbi:hypothetical protein CGMCC3_g15444 [Colletotrichum fructicola]|nr:uncharacterized protein CGMCC3_g15444 [Colletotrichum fructicola]KAE9568346.1 hypothetical protein CGMCC3_g15444 [Colletotrichum fructicola]